MNGENKERKHFSFQDNGVSTERHRFTRMYANLSKHSLSPIYSKLSGEEWENNERKKT